MVNSTVTISTTLTSSFEPAGITKGNNSYVASTDYGVDILFVSRSCQSMLHTMFPVGSQVCVTGEPDCVLLDGSFSQVLRIVNIQALLP